MKFSHAAGLMGLFGAASAQSKVRVMPLGDSITEITCWRSLVWDNLVDAGLADSVDFVGSMTNNPQRCTSQYGNWDMGHEGHSGWLAINIANSYLDGWLTSTPADIVMFMLGTNDSVQGRTTQAIIAAYTRMVNIMRDHNPSMKIIVDLVIPLSFGGNQINALNAMIPGWAEGMNSTESPIYIVDTSTTGGYTAAMNRDGVHPNAAGDEVIARQLTPTLIKTIEDFMAESGM